MTLISSFFKWLTCVSILLHLSLIGEEKLFCPFDDRIWEIGFQDQTENEKIVELVLANETIAHWNELFTLQIFNHLPISASEFMDALERESKIHLPSEKVYFNVIEKEPLHIFENSFLMNQEKGSSPTMGNDEYNIGRLLQGKNALYYIRYSTKDAKLFKQNQEAWIKRFQSAYLAETSRQHPGRWVSFTSSGVYQQDQPLKYQTEYQFIDNQEIGYAMTLPKEWSVQQVNPSPSSTHFEVLRFAAPDKAIEGKITFLDLQQIVPIGTALQRFYDSYQLQHPQAKIVEQGQIQNVIGQSGHYFMISNGTQRGEMTCFAMNKRVYCLEFWTTDAQFQRFSEIIKTIIVNFQVQPKKVENESANQTISDF